jgi:hypothetical protein
MTFSDEDKVFLIETIGRIVDAATTTLQQDLTFLKDGQAEHSRKLALLEQGQAQMRQGQADIGSRLIDLQIDIQDTKRHVANISRDRMVTSAREEKTEQRLTTVEAAVAELKARLISEP